MDTFKEFLGEASLYKHPAEREYYRLKNLCSTVGSNRGDARVVYDHKGGDLRRTMVYDNDQSYTHRKGKHFGMHYSSSPGHNVFVHAHFKGTVPKDVDKLVNHIEDQNPHCKGTGHARALARDIIKHHHTTASLHD